jgi:hypothetical protein
MDAATVEAVELAKEQVFNNRSCLHMIKSMSTIPRPLPDEVKRARELLAEAVESELPEFPHLILLRLKVAESDALDRYGRATPDALDAAVAEVKAIRAALRSVVPLDPKALGEMTYGDLNQFIAERCVLAERGLVSVSKLHAAFIVWAARHGATGMVTLSKFSQRLKRSDRVKKVRHADGIYYRGISLKGDAPATTQATGGTV